ncbi:MAG: hypothetical protein ACO1N0_15130 [Fluviicola sp.]
MIASAMITNQNGNLFPLFDLNSPVNVVRLFVGHLDVLFAGKSPIMGACSFSSVRQRANKKYH